jgi:hypothetical protein
MVFGGELTSFNWTKFGGVPGSFTASSTQLTFLGCPGYCWCNALAGTTRNRAYSQGWHFQGNFWNYPPLSTCFSFICGPADFGIWARQVSHIYVFRWALIRAGSELKDWSHEGPRGEAWEAKARFAEIWPSGWLCCLRLLNASHRLGPWKFGSYFLG